MLIIRPIPEIENGSNFQPLSFSQYIQKHLILFFLNLTYLDVLINLAQKVIFNFGTAVAF